MSTFNYSLWDDLQAFDLNQELIKLEGRRRVAKSPRRLRAIRKKIQAVKAELAAVELAR